MKDQTKVSNFQPMCIYSCFLAILATILWSYQTWIPFFQDLSYWCNYSINIPPISSKIRKISKQIFNKKKHFLPFRIILENLSGLDDKSSKTNIFLILSYLLNSIEFVCIFYYYLTECSVKFFLSKISNIVLKSYLT